MSGLESHWSHRDATSTLLAPLAALFGAMAALRRQLYERGLLTAQHAGVPVIVVGNITVGGTGKTPLVIALVAALRQQGYRPGIVSRGYGGTHAHQSTAQLVVQPDAARYGDEVALLCLRTGLPIAVGARRAAAARLLRARHAEIDVIVCDDGLQHYGLARDIELVVFDERRTGNGRLLPAGPLREPLARAAQASALILNGGGRPPLEGPAAPPSFDMHLLPGEAYQLAAPGERRPLSRLPGPRRLAAAGIGNPARFFAMLQAAGVACDTLALPDHFDYRDNPFAGREADCILITEKDAVKCNHLNDARLWVVPVDAALDDNLIPYLIHLLRALPIPRPAAS